MSAAGHVPAKCTHRGEGRGDKVDTVLTHGGVDFPCLKTYTRVDGLPAEGTDGKVW